MFHFLKEKFTAAMLKKCCLVFSVCFTFKNYAQVFYSTNPNYLKTKTEQNNLLSQYKSNYPDTALTEFGNFFPRNFMGNIGLPAPSYLFNYGADNLGFRFFKPPTQNELFKENEIEYMRTNGPYANLTGIAGSKQLQIFKMIFTHTYKEKVNVTLKFNRYTSQGFYLKQQTYVNNFFLTSNYTTSTKRFGYYFYILNNGTKNQENGGIHDLTLNDSSVLLNKDLFKVNLNGANRDNRETKVMINPWLRLNKKSDSLTMLDHYLQIKSAISFNSYKYKDVNLAIDKFYNLFYLDTALTRDSSNVRQFINEVNYSLLSKNQGFGFSAGYKNEVNQLWQKYDSTFFNHILQSDLFSRKDFFSQDTLHHLEKYLESKLSASYIFSGANFGNYKVESNTVFTFNADKNRAFFLSVLFEKRNADYIYNNWVSNHFFWFNNGFKAQEQLQVKTGIKLGKNFSTSVFYQNYLNYLYFDNIALPRQYNKPLSNLGISVNFSKVFFKHLGIALNHVFQQTSNTAYIRVPQNSSTAKLFYNGNLFKNNLQLQIGSQIQVYQSFFSYAYMPATQTFYLQDKFETAAYPYLDVYLNARIHPVSIFLKLENALQGLAGTNYAFVPGYYQTDRAFRFGISWMFFD